MILLFVGGTNAYGSGTVTPTGALTKEITHSFAGGIASSGLRWNNVYVVPDGSGAITLTGTLTKVFLRNFPAGITPIGVTLVSAARGGSFQIDENVGLALVVSKDGTWQIDEDVILLTAAASRDGVLQTDENMRPKAPVPVTSY